MTATKESIFSVKGMTCSSCVRHVEGALRKLAGVVGVQVELASGKVVVQHDPAQATSGQMIQAITHEGYQAQIADLI